MRPHTRLLAALLVALLCSCATPPPPIKPVPGTLVPVTDAKPLVRAVELQTQRLETRVADTARRVATIDDAVSKAVEEAIRSGDATREEEARRFQTQLRELRSITETTANNAIDLQKDAAVAHAELLKAATERDAAFLDREKIRSQWEDSKDEFKISLSRMDEKRLAEATRATWWKKWALITWATLGVLTALFILSKFR